MNILIETVKHEDQRYPTVGDWEVDTQKDTIHIKVSQMGNFKYEALVAVHELIEILLCLDRGISQEIVDKFDIEYEKKRKDGDESEPGDDAHAPYRKEHFFATNIERLLAAEYGINWANYDAAVNEL